MKEIGGYFGLEQMGGQEYYPELIALNTGRNALAWLIKARHIQRIYIPYFLCGSVSGVCERCGCSYEYYSIAQDFTPAFEKTLGEGEWLYVVNFYGQLSNDSALELQRRYRHIIFDNVQAFFQRPVDGIDTIYSCRKFFGVPDGAYLATDAVLSDELETDISKDRMKHILGRFEGCASDYHGDFKTNDRSFVEQPLRYMSKLTHNLLRGIDYEAIRVRRNDNYAILANWFDAQNPLTLTSPDGPYAYPLYCENGMELKKRLAAQKIYVATLWPNVLEMGDALSRDYAENILPLPCDQRYGEEDMQWIIRAVNECNG